MTALCVKALVQEGRLSFSSPIGRYLTPPIAMAPELAKRPLSKFILHISGLNMDETQAYDRAKLARRGHAFPTSKEAAVRALSRAPGPANIFFYNNENYAVLEQLIEKVAKADYMTACTKLLFDPLDVRAAPDPVTAPALAYGGLSMSTENIAKAVYATIIDAAYGQEPKNYPHTKIGKEVYYGLGTFFKEAPDGWRFWHFGGYCTGSTADAGSFFVALPRGIVIATTYNFCATQKDMSELYKALIDAAEGL